MRTILCSALLTLTVFLFAAPLVAFQAPAKQVGGSPKRGDSKINPIDGLRYFWIPPGSYVWGCSPGDKQCYEDEMPNRKITLTKGFWLGETEVPQSAFEKITGENPSNFRGANLPAEEITYDLATEYCGKIGGRLPTEAEWEYAARAGTTGPRYGDLDKIAWYFKNSNFSTHPVGQKEPNAFGLRDMLGNVIEWTSTFFTVQHNQENIDPKGPNDAEYRTLRGGGWFDDPELVRASNRTWFEDGDTDYNVGFRCVSP